MLLANGRARYDWDDGLIGKLNLQNAQPIKMMWGNLVWYYSPLFVNLVNFLFLLQVEEECGGIPMVLVQNKIDLIDDAKVKV